MPAVSYYQYFTPSANSLEAKGNFLNIKYFPDFPDLGNTGRIFTVVLHREQLEMRHYFQG